MFNKNTWQDFSPKHHRHDNNGERRDYVNKKEFLIFFDFGTAKNIKKHQIAAEHEKDSHI